MSGLRHKTIIGRERALIDALTNALQRVTEGMPPSKKTLAQLRLHRSSRVYPTGLGNTFEIQVHDPDRQATGHIVRVTVELDRFEEVPRGETT